MAALRLSYLPFQAMAETTRFLFRYGGVKYQDEVVWGHVFSERRRQGEYPFDKVPVLYIDGMAVAQSGSIARFAAKLAACYPADPARCALNDAVFEMAQELCTINPMINCYTGGEFERVKRWYFGFLPQHLANLDAQLEAATRSEGSFFGGSAPSHADFNVYHHLANARLVEPQCIPESSKLCHWMELMELLPSMKQYLEERPRLVGIGTDPGLVDKAGRFLSQRDPEGRAILDICAVAPDNIHETWYSLKVNVTRHYSTRLRSLAIVGKDLEPAFDPEVQQYTVHIDGKEKEVDLRLTAEDDEAAIKVDADKTTHGSDSIATTVKMHDNEHLEVGEPPQWSRSVSVQLESADGEKTLTYLVHIKQKVSNYSYLMNLSMDNTSCQMNPPKFQHNVTEYSCVFWWTETESPRVIATMDPLNPDEEKCPDCTLLIPSAREFPNSHLSLQYQTQLKRVHQSGEVWTRPFLYGEAHLVPFQVLSADKFTHTTYHVHLERDAPWWMKTATTRAISSWATTLATCMAIFSASNFVALTRMIQFMDLTTEIKGRPDVYSDFAQHLKGFNFDPAPYLPDMGLPSLEAWAVSPAVPVPRSYQDVRDMRNKAVQQLKDAFSVGDMKKSGTLVLQYCYALHVEGQLAANGILYSHPDGTKLLMESLASVDDMFSETEPETERKLVLHDGQSRAANLGNSTFRSLRGVRKYAGDFCAWGLRATSIISMLPLYTWSLAIEGGS
eukprot:s233_g31.t1